MWMQHASYIISYKQHVNFSWCHIFNHVRPFYEWVVSDLDRSTHRSVWVYVTHSLFIEGSHTTKNTASEFLTTFLQMPCKLLKNFYEPCMNFLQIIYDLLKTPNQFLINFVQLSEKPLRNFFTNFLLCSIFGHECFNTRATIALVFWC
jgi:hypothetical protein